MQTCTECEFFTIYSNLLCVFSFFFFFSKKRSVTNGLTVSGAPPAAPEIFFPRSAGILIGGVLRRNRNLTRHPAAKPGPPVKTLCGILPHRSGYRMKMRSRHPAAEIGIANEFHLRYSAAEIGTKEIRLRRSATGIVTSADRAGMITEIKGGTDR